MTDFVNFKMKLNQSFRSNYKYRVYVHIFIWLNTRTCMKKNLYLYCVCKKTICAHETSGPIDSPNPHPDEPHRAHVRTVLFVAEKKKIAMLALPRLPLFFFTSLPQATHRHTASRTKSFGVSSRRRVPSPDVSPCTPSLELEASYSHYCY
jgi:hypothetical protein